MTTKDLQRLTVVRRLAASGEARRRREAAGISLAELAEHCGVDASSVWRWERGVRRPRGDAALRYGRLLDLLAPGSSREAS
jgi:transcriptional regulator with XRE-family HTH domain